MLSQPEEVVRAVYALLLNREPEPEGLAHWTAALEGGLPREQFVGAVLASDEYRRNTCSPSAAVAYDDVDLIIPLRGHELRVPAADSALVPYLLRDRCWEPHITHYLEHALNSSSTFVDVGANVGYFTVLCASLARRVVSFEPVRRNYRYCAANLVLNQLTNVELHPLGLWHEDAIMPLRTDSIGVNAAIDPAGGGLTETDAIEVVSLDSFVARGRLALPRLDVLKLDVEGAELSALKGMRETIARLRPHIVMELNRPMLATFGVTIDDVWQFLREFGYEIRAFEPWRERDPVVVDLSELRRRCPADSLIDIVAVFPA